MSLAVAHGVAQQRGMVQRPMTRRMRLVRRFYAGSALVLPPLGAVAAVVWCIHYTVPASAVYGACVLYLASQLGVTLGYHRLLSHRSFAAHPALEALLIAFGAMAGQGAPIKWAADHRRHHKHADRDGDPHSPHCDGARPLRGLRAFWHAHVGWTLQEQLTSTPYYCRDLLRRPLVRFFNRSYPYWLLLGLLLPALAGYLVDDSTSSAVAGLLWGGFVRLLFSYHFAFAVNSLAHMRGSQPFATGDQSRNLPWLALPTLGEGWHNNHHARPSSPYFADRPWQLDLGGLCLRLLCALGLAAPQVGRGARPTTRQRGR